jgi:hypothetical protein
MSILQATKGGDAAIDQVAALVTESGWADQLEQSIGR